MIKNYLGDKTVKSKIDRRCPLTGNQKRRRSDMKTGKLLQINPTPPLIGYIHHAYPFSIMSCRNEYLPWFHSNFIQISDKEGNSLSKSFIDFYVHFSYAFDPSPWLRTLRFDRNLITNSNIISEFVSSCLEQDYYVQLSLNERYLPFRAAYEKIDFIHENLIWGVDYSTRIFKTLGFNKKRNYCISDMQFCDLLNAYDAVDLRGYHDNCGIRLFKYLGEESKYAFRGHTQYSFDVQLVFELTQDYLLSRNTGLRYRALSLATTHGKLIKDGIFGLDIYRRIDGQLERLLLDNAQKFEWDKWISIHIFWEHKKCMLGRIKFMENHNFLNANNSFSKAYHQVEKDAALLRQLIMKYTFKRDPSIIIRMRILLHKILETEQSILEKFIDAIVLK